MGTNDQVPSSGLLADFSFFLLFFYSSTLKMKLDLVAVIGVSVTLALAIHASPFRADDDVAALLAEAEELQKDLHRIYLDRHHQMRSADAAMKKRASFFSKLGSWFNKITAKPKCDEEGMANGGTLNRIKCGAKKVVGFAHNFLNSGEGGEGEEGEGEGEGEEGKVARIA